MGTYRGPSAVIPRTHNLQTQGERAPEDAHPARGVIKCASDRDVRAHVEGGPELQVTARDPQSSEGSAEARTQPQPPSSRPSWRHRI